VLFACNKSESYPEVQIFGHAGMGMNIGYSIYHDNSEESIDLALSLPNIDGVEMDVRMSKDSTLWLFHENRLEATTNGIGCIADLHDYEIAQLHYKSIHGKARLNSSKIKRWAYLHSRPKALEYLRFFCAIRSI
jgi:glycerophosphoryl diester phosphodiesterase